MGRGRENVTLVYLVSAVAGGREDHVTSNAFNAISKGNSRFISAEIGKFIYIYLFIYFLYLLYILLKSTNARI